MNDRSIWADRGNRLKGWSLVVFASLAEFVKDFRTFELVKIVVWLLEFSLKEGEVLDDGSTVTDVRLAHAFLLSGILLCFHVLHDVLVCVDSLFFEKLKDFSIQGTLMYSNFLARRRHSLQVLKNLLVWLHFNTLASQVLLH